MSNLDNIYDELDTGTADLPEGWKSAPSLQDLKTNFQGATEHRDKNLNQIDTWLDNYHITGKAVVKPPKGFSSVQPKLIRKQAEWRYAPLSEPFLATADLFVASPVSFEDKEGAIQHELLLNNQFSTVIDRVAFIDDYVRTAVDEGTVIVRVGWEFEEAMEKESVPVYEFIALEAGPAGDTDLQNLELASAGKMHHMPEWEDALQHSQIANTPLRPSLLRYEEREVMKTIKNHPTVEVVDIHNITLDPTCRNNIAMAKFIVYTFETSKAELEAADRYINLDKIVISASAKRASTNDHVASGDTNFNFNDKDHSKFVAYEYWGYHDTLGDGTMRPFVATWVGDVLIRIEDNPFPDKKFPFIKVQYLPVRKSMYGEPDGALIEDNQKIIGAITRGMLDVMGRSANGQTGVHKGALDVPNRRRYDAGLDYEFNSNINPQNAFYMHKYPEIPSSAPLLLQHQNNEADSFTGVKAFSGGLNGDALGRTSAAGVRGVLDAASKREVAILRRLAAGIVEIGKKIIAMNTVFLDETEVIRVTNNNFVEIHRDKLIGRFDLKLSISTAEEDEAKAEELAFMLQTVAQTVGPGLTQTILSDIARLRKMPDLAEKIASYVHQPDPLEQELKQLEIELKKTEIMERQAEAQERIANAQLLIAKVQTEAAKAQDLQANTDVTNLEMIEQESGVKQQRDIEAIQAQAKGNMQRDLLQLALKRNEATKPEA